MSKQTFRLQTVRLTMHSGKKISETEVSLQAKIETSTGGGTVPMEPSPGVGGCSLLPSSPVQR